VQQFKKKSLQNCVSFESVVHAGAEMGVLWQPGNRFAVHFSYR